MLVANRIFSYLHSMTSLQFSGELKGLLQNLVARGLNGEESPRWHEEMCDADELDGMCTGALKDYRSVTQLVQPYSGVFFCT